MRHKGVLDGFELGRKDAEDMIMAARVHAGWIKAEDLLPPVADETGEGDAGADAGEGGKDAAAEG